MIASNRDEYLDRPSLPLSRWQSAAGQTIVSGRDARGGGTWFGLTPAGRVAFLTNVREKPEVALPPAPRSRGELAMRWLEGNMDAAQYMAQMDCTSYRGFNLVLGDWQTKIWTWLSNRGFDANGATLRPPQHTGWRSRSLPSGIYGLSNAGLDTPWPKTVALRKALAETLRAATETPETARLEAPLWDALASRTLARDEYLPDTGMTPTFERPLSSAFVEAPERAYGTVSSTLLLVEPEQHLQRKNRWAVQIIEKTPTRSATTAARPDAMSNCSVARVALQWAAPS